MPDSAAVLERFDDGARLTRDMAFEEARSLGHEQVGTEHLLLGLLRVESSNAARSLARCGATLEGCRAKAAEAVATKRQPSARGELTLTDRATRALERANRMSLRERCQYVEPDHILVSVLDVEGTAGQVLRGLGIDPATIREAVRTSAAPTDMVQPPASTGHRPKVEGPSCPKCGLSLESTLTHRSLASKDDTGDPISWLIAYCSSCGSAIGCSAAPAVSLRRRPSGA